MVIPLEYDTDRPVLRRTTARVLIVDPNDHVLLLEDSDPSAPGAPSVWITPGGGLEGDETPEMAAIRELAEETGLVVDPEDLKGPFAQRNVVHGYSTKVVVQHEIFFLVRAHRFDPVGAALTSEEHLTFRSMRWWAAAEIAAAHDQLIWPVGLPTVIPAAVDPRLWPVALSEAEESTVRW